MRYRAVLFDLDGTLLDTAGDLAAAVNFALDKGGFPQRTVGEVRSFIGKGVRELIRRSLPQGAADALVEKTLRDFTAYYAAHATVLTAPYRGIRELLSSLRAAGFLLAVVSNKADIFVQEIVSHYFPDCFDLIMGEREGLARKPAPDMVEYALSQLGVDAEKAVYVGDMDVDIKTARAAKTPSVSVAWGFRDRAFLLSHGATAVVDNAEELQQMLL